MRDNSKKGPMRRARARQRNAQRSTQIKNAVTATLCLTTIVGGAFIIPFILPKAISRPIEEKENVAAVVDMASTPYGQAEYSEYMKDQREKEAVERERAEFNARKNSRDNATLISCSTYLDKREDSDYSLTGKEEWLGKTAKLYAVDDDGSCGTFIGEYKFTAVGHSQGIECGTEVAIRCNTQQSSENWTDIYGKVVYIYVE